ncbi:MAG: 30S ribosomal protein S7 [Candidatus Moraniibacteriota bacterium]|nr:MAG: 30S ribosomal protein S7 [Candidatus Moranbacteria bacterium]
MPRRKRKFRKSWRPDPQYNNLLVGRFIGQITLNGKRSTAERLVYDAFDIIHKKSGKGGLNVFEQAIKNVSPLVALKSRRVGGANYQVPVPVVGERRQTLAMRWIREACRKGKGRGFAEKLATELMAAAEKEGAAMKKREETHRMAEANKAFAHFA